MAVNKELKIEVGDEFKDLDPRLAGARVIKVTWIGKQMGQGPEIANVETIAAPTWTPRAVGRRTTVKAKRLRDDRLYEKISR
jgi:hypothetical protein